MLFDLKKNLHEVDVREWQPEADERIFVTELTGAEFTEFEKIKERFFNGNERDQNEAYARIAVKFALTADGKPFFDDSDIERLAKGSNKPLRRIFAKLMELNDIDPKTLEELEKN